MTLIYRSVTHNDAENMCISQDLMVPGVQSLPYTGQQYLEVLFTSECYILKETVTQGEHLQGAITRMTEFLISSNVFVRTRAAGLGEGDLQGRRSQVFSCHMKDGPGAYMARQLGVSSGRGGLKQ